jgi:cellulose synthase/poly-beta-1,6-N-acetylglucosamine synthase-like glycosyltransferase
MTLWATILFYVLAGLAAAQALATFGFVEALRRTRRVGRESPPCAKTAVILCLRGSDPFLADCLQGLLHQDYPCYDVRIVIDSPDDPAWGTVERVVAHRGAANVQVRALTERRPTCSLKCSSLVQATSELDDSYEIIALVDADVVPHPTWLRELVAPLADERVAATTGNRWYMPHSMSWGSLMRWLWNAAAVVQMYWYGIPWGGTLAFKTSAFREGRLQEQWAHSFGEDTTLYRVFRRLGYRTVFVPGLMMVNREGCRLADFYRWVHRQFLTTRLHHPGWPLVVGHNLAVFLAQGIGLVSLLVAAVTRNGPAVRWLLAGMGVYWGIMVGLLATLEVSVRRVLAARREPTSWLRVSGLLRTAIAMPLTQAIHFVALLRAWTCTEVNWRGIRYRVQGPGQIRMTQYDSFRGRPGSDRISESL